MAKAFCKFCNKKFKNGSGVSIHERNCKATVATQANTKILSGLIDEPQQTAVDIHQIEKYNYRRGLLDAIAAIFNELRHSGN